MFARKLSKEYTLEEYFRLEERSDLKHEFHDGVVYSMVGGSLRHAGLALKINGSLDQFLSEKECRVVGSDARLEIRIAENNQTRTHFVYPDGAVTCDSRDTVHSQNLRFPKVIIEVLSPTTAQYDRTDKFELYKHVPTLEDYVLVSQDELRIDVIHKMQDHPRAWLSKTSLGGDVFEIGSLGFSSSVDQIYADWC